MTNLCDCGRTPTSECVGEFHFVKCSCGRTGHTKISVAAAIESWNEIYKTPPLPAEPSQPRPSKVTVSGKEFHDLCAQHRAGNCCIHRLEVGKTNGEWIAHLYYPQNATQTELIK